MAQQPTSVSYTGDGTTTSFTIPFVFVSRSDIQIFINGVQTWSYSWSSNGQVVFTTAPVNGAYVLIGRATKADTSGFNFQSGALRPADLNNAMRQVLYIAQEAFETALGSLRQNLLGVWDALSYRITDVADPINPQDAATMNWVSALVVPIANTVSSLTTNTLQLAVGVWNAANRRISSLAAPIASSDAATAGWVLEQISASLMSTGSGVSKSVYLTAMEQTNPGSIGTLVNNIPPDPANPVNVSFYHNPNITVGDVTYTFIEQLFPSMNMAAVNTAAGLT